ncbi:hypothetical protein DSLASN_01860 [Desulfoluna limicola]|uniref:Toprim domain-containing protein n=1 Tax=Desulfoluna limicola TaxID=2810562 RepID=A0ABM7PAB0_9BACT|nr:universal stress protein [Desulfoluna limicola]BCS94554.1 hypothetical protein DSLASN_01860 [Desulfoluna limicola]
MPHQTQRILIALDGSGQGLKAAEYAANIIKPETSDITLFLVESPLPESLWDNKSEETNIFESPIANGWWEEQLEANRKSLETARKTFLESGFPDTSVHIKIAPRETGIARDIIKESKKGYDMVVAGRVGHSIHTGSTLGNCARKMVSALTHTTLVVVGGQPDNSSVLIGFDASKGSKKCLHMAEQVITRRVERVHLCYVSRSLNIMSGAVDPFESSLGVPQMVEQEHQVGQRNRMLPILKSAEEQLLQCGFPKAAVASMIMKSYLSRSEGLVTEAQDRGYGTIMVGRRGHSIVEEFFLGRVGEKLVQLAEDRAVWIVH